jgi:hypothetical protein
MCSTFGIRDFPILNSVNVTPSLNAAVYEEIPLDIQWGPKATEPQFIHSGPYANLGYIEYLDAGASTTTLRLNGNSFGLISVQLCSPQHTTLLPREKQSDCSGELVMGFRAQNTISESYLFLCVPILTRATQTLSTYLEALRMGQLDGKPTSLLSLLPPTDKHYVSYSTCLQRREQSSTSTQQVRVFVFTEGLAYPNGNFQEILNKLQSPRPSGRILLPAIQLPDGLVDKSQAMLFSIATETDYKSLLRYSQYDPNGVPDSSRYREDSLNSYKCVPLEPSQNIKDGKIIVDTENGELLSQVLKDKQDSGPAKRSKISPAMIEKIVAAFLALIAFIVLFLIVFYVIANFVTPNADTFFGVVKQNMDTIGPVVVFSMLSGIICFILGFFLYTLL